jgi:hypothetical protein
MRIGEIIETGSMGFVAESFELNRPPALGRLVIVSVQSVPNNQSAAGLYAVVTDGWTAGIDPSRRAVRRGTPDVYDAAIYQESPELAHILRTEFRAVLVGYTLHDQVRQHLPPQPPPLHYSVEDASSEKVRLFTNELRYLRILRDIAGVVSSLQVLAAHIRQVYAQRGQDNEWLQAAAREVSVLLKGDYDSLLTVLYAVDPGEVL